MLDYKDSSIWLMQGDCLERNHTIKDFRLDNGEWAKTFKVGNKWLSTKANKVWNSMISRCTSGSKAQGHRPTYSNCSVSQEFTDFQYFANWYISQVGYGEDGYHLDKDLLVKNNKVYSQNTCVLIPSELNSFLLKKPTRTNGLPQGVTVKNTTGRFHAQISIGGRVVHIGYYLTIAEAEEAYIRCKEKEARRWYNRLLDGEFIVDSRVIERMKSWTYY